MAEKSQIKITAGQNLANQDGLSNIGENQATMKALAQANVDGTTIFPTEVNAQRLSVVDGSFQGNLYSGSMLVGSGGMVITSDPGGAAPSGTGISISSSVISLIKNSVPVVTLDGVNGTASFAGAITATSGSFPGSLMTGSIAVGAGGIVIGNVTAGVSISDNIIRCIKSGVPTVVIDGDTGFITATKFSLTSDATSTVNLSAGSITIGGGATINSVAASTVVAGAAAGAAAILPGGGVSLDANRYITTIDVSAGIVIKTGTGTTRTQITANGMAVYLSDALKVQIDHTNGIWINNTTTPVGLTERLSLAYAGTEKGRLYADTNGVRLWSTNSHVIIGTGADAAGGIDMYPALDYGGEVAIYGDVRVFGTLYLGGTYGLYESGGNLYWRGVQIS